MVPDNEDDDDSSDDDWGDPGAKNPVATAAAASAVITVDFADSGAAAAEAATTDPAGRMCRCGSLEHQTVQHRMCPLNKSADLLELFPGDEHKRLLRYVPRKYLYRYYDFSDGSRRRCHGSVTSVTDESLLRITYTDGGHDDVTEKELLGIFAQMKRDRSNKRKHGGSCKIPRRRLFDNHS